MPDGAPLKASAKASVSVSRACCRHISSKGGHGLAASIGDFTSRRQPRVDGEERGAGVAGGAGV